MLDVAGIVGSATALFAVHAVYLTRMPGRIDEALRARHFTDPDDLRGQLEQLLACRRSQRWFLVGHAFVSAPLMIVAAFAVVSIHPRKSFDVTLFAGFALGIAALARLWHIRIAHSELAEMVSRVSSAHSKAASRQLQSDSPLRDK